MTNELVNQSQETQTPQVVQDEYGKFKRVATYHNFTSIEPKSRAEKVELYNLLNGDLSTPMRDAVGSKFKIRDIITKTYESVDENTGEIENGVTTLLVSTDGSSFVTSSKSLYFTVVNLVKAFGKPTYTDDEAIEVEIIAKKSDRSSNKIIDLKLLG